jgi:YD repeat-containing protein
MTSNETQTALHLRVGVLALLALSFVLCSAPGANADLTFGTFGSAAGLTEKPENVAVDYSDGTLYVADRGNNRVDVFDSAGNFIRAFGWGVADGVSSQPQTCSATCFTGVAGAGKGQFDGLTGIAVDNDSTSSSYRDVYVLDENHRVQKFSPSGEFILMFGSGVNKSTGKDICTAASGNTCGIGATGGGEGQINIRTDPIAVGPGGSVYVGDSVPIGNGEFSTRIEKFEPSGAVIGEIPLSGSRPLYGLAVNSAGDFYVSREGTEGIRHYDAAGNPISTLDTGLWTTTLAIDPADNLFASQRDGSPAVGEYDVTGNIVRRFGYQVDADAVGLAPFHTSAGDLFLSEGWTGEETGKLFHIPFPPPGPLVMPTLRPGAVGGSRATKASPIGNATATFHAYVNPEGKASTVHFEYVTQKGFDEGGFSSPATKSTPEIAVGSDFVMHQATLQATGLTPETVFHFRAVASNADGSNAGPAATFETLPPLQIDAVYATEVGPDSARLNATVNPLGIPATGYFEYVDDAAYQETGFEGASEIPNISAGAPEIVFGSAEAPVTRGVSLDSLAADTIYHYRIVVTNPLIEPIVGPERSFRTFPQPVPVSTDCANKAFRTGASAGLPDCRAYEMVSPVDKNNGDVFAPSLFFYTGLDQSAVDGNSLTYSSYRAFDQPAGGPFVSQYLSSRGAGGWSNRSISPPQGPKQLGGFHVDNLNSQYQIFSDDLSRGLLWSDSYQQLAPGASDGVMNLYRRESDSGAYSPIITVKPPHAYGGTIPHLRGESSDGSHVLFNARDNLTPDAPDLPSEISQLYESFEGEVRLVSILPNGLPSKVTSVPGFVNNASYDWSDRQGNTLHAISEDGTRIFWTALEGSADLGHLYVRIDGQETVDVSKSSGVHYDAAAADGSKVLFRASAGNLYEFAVDSRTKTLIASGVTGVLGASDDASRVYFVSKQALAAGANAGKMNLYLADNGTLTFVATLSDRDGTSSSGYPAPVARELTLHTARVTPDGAHVAFMSTASLTGYDNTDAVSGEADAEVYLYDADTQELQCVSCNPSGARPVGRRLLGPNRTPSNVWAAGRIQPFQTQLHGPHLLSDDGSRLFFESFEALVPQDTNGKQDVYEWERVGAGDCTEPEGCVRLISSGTGHDYSELVDASADGRDVFIRTSASLLSQDPGLVDIYDAREGGGFAPPPAPPGPCEGDACQPPISPPNDQTPASAVFHGAGNRGKSRKHNHANRRRQQAKRRRQQARKHRHATKNHRRQRSHGRASR